MAVIGMSEMTQLMKYDMVSQKLRQAHKIEVEVDVALRRTAAPIGSIMLDSHAVICKSVTGCQFCQTARELGLGLLSELLDFIRRGHLHVLVFLLMLGHRLQNPPAAGFEEQLGRSIRHYVRHRHAYTLDGMHAYADAPAPQTLAEHHLPDLGIIQYLSCRFRHRLVTDLVKEAQNQGGKLRAVADI